MYYHKVLAKSECEIIPNFLKMGGEAQRDQMTLYCFCSLLIQLLSHLHLSQMGCFSMLNRETPQCPAHPGPQHMGVARIGNVFLNSCIPELEHVLSCPVWTMHTHSSYVPQL